MTGDFIVSIVSIMISRLKNDDVTIILSTVRNSQLMCITMCNGV